MHSSFELWFFWAHSVYSISNLSIIDLETSFWSYLTRDPQWFSFTLVKLRWSIPPAGFADTTPFGFILHELKCWTQMIRPFALLIRKLSLPTEDPRPVLIDPQQRGSCGSFDEISFSSHQHEDLLDQFLCFFDFESALIGLFLLDRAYFALLLLC